MRTVLRNTRFRKRIAALSVLSVTLLLAATVTLTTSSPAAAAACPCTIWTSAATPATAAQADTSAVEVGVKFRSDVDGFVSAVRFYKGTGNTGTHVGNLWSATGTRLATATFSGESASGWQQVNFASPVAVSANVTYVASYFAPVGRYAGDNNALAAAVDSPPLHTLADGAGGGNGVYRYGATSGFPSQSYQASNYWVDVVLTTGPDTTAPTVITKSPAAGAAGVAITSNITATFSESVQPTTVSFVLRDPANAVVPAAVTYDDAARTSTLNPDADLFPATTYTATLSGAQDPAGNTLAGPVTWSFTTAPAPAPAGPGGPVLVIANSANQFSRYYAEILRAEGLNEYKVLDISTVTASVLATYDVAILGETALNDTQVSMFTTWVNGGGNLVAMRPDKKLAGLLGLTDAASTLSNSYLLADTTTGPGVGIVNQTIQYHGAADRYTLGGAAAVATLYSSATTATANPAVSLRSVGGLGGQAAAFTYDLARSVIYTRQGNPAWAGQARSGGSPTRAVDLFWGAASFDPQPDWIDLNKVAVPQADEQQRLLANLIASMTLDRKPLPRFWYLPNGKKAVVAMTGDDHANGGTAGRFDTQQTQSAPGCSVANWECIRSTSYVYPTGPLTNAQAASYTAAGFEVALHVNTSCAGYTAASLETNYASQLASLASQLPSNPASTTERSHCIPWSDWASQPKVQLAHGIRLDTNYYYYPPSWAGTRPGFFTGSGMPMRFGDLDGTSIDVYQAATQMTDESGQAYPSTIDTLLDRATGPEGYYAAFTANMHTDVADSAGSDAIVASAKARGIPVVSERQLLTWVDGRNNSSFGSMAWSGSKLSFTIGIGTGATGLQAMLPTGGPAGATLSGLTLNGTPVPTTTQTIKGVQYAFFPAGVGSYQASYGVDTTPPTVPVTAPASGAVGVAVSAAVTATFSEPVQPATVSFTLRDPSNAVVPAVVSYDGPSRTATLKPNANLAPSTVYTATVSGAQDMAGNPMAAPAVWSFTTAAADTTPPTVTATSPTSGAVGVGVAAAVTATFSEPVQPATVSFTLRDPSNAVVPGLVSYDGPSRTATLKPNANLVGSTVYTATVSGAQDLAGNPMANPAVWSFTTAAAASGCPCTIWAATAVPGTPSAADTGAVELGVKFRSDVAGFVTGVRFYKGGGNTGSHVGSLWSATGTRLATATFSGESATGWQQVNFTSPVAVNAGVTYVASYFAPVGGYAADGGAFAAAGVASPPLRALANGVDGGNGVYAYGAASAFPAQSYQSTNYWVDVVFTDILGPDTTPPVISGVAAAPAPRSAVVTWSTNEASDSRVDYGLSPSSLTSSATDTVLTTSHSLALTGLSPSTVYSYRVTSRDAAGNTTTFPTVASAPNTFTTAAPAVVDSTVSDFALGTPGPTAYLADTSGGEVALAPTVGAEFSGAALPPGWSSTVLQTGGTATVGAGALTVNGATAQTTATYAPGRSLEFVATFANVANQHVGFGLTLNETPWAMFGTSTGGALFARSRLGTLQTNTNLGAGLLGGRHRFRIDWNTADIVYSVDGAVVATHNVVIITAMRPVVRDNLVSGAAVVVDWLRVTPYQSSGTFTSRVLDAGVTAAWSNAIWNADMPAGTTLSISVRTGNTATPDGTWSAFTPLSGSGASVGATSRYLQYRVDLTTTSAGQTPALRDITFQYS